MVDQKATEKSSRSTFGLLRHMRITVYIPQTFTINESDLPALTSAARRRHKIPANKNVLPRHIIEEARRAGLIKLGRDYCLDLTTTRMSMRVTKKKLLKGSKDSQRRENKKIL